MAETIPYCPRCLDTAPAPHRARPNRFDTCLCGIQWDDRSPYDTSHALSIDEIERRRWGKARRITDQILEKEKLK